MIRVSPAGRSVRSFSSFAGLSMMLAVGVLISAILAHPCAAQTVTTVFGGWVGDGYIGRRTGLIAPSHVLEDAGLNHYFSDSAGQRIRKQSHSTGKSSTIAGTGIAGFNGDGIAATTAQVNFPNGMVFSAAGNIVFADTGNNRIRMIGADGTISTLAGHGSLAGYKGDGGPVTAAQLNQPWGVAYDTAGSLYFAETGNHVVRKVDTSGTISTFAGTGVAGYSGDGGVATSAQLNSPLGVAFDTAGNLYVADTGNRVIRQILLSGTIVTFAGNGQPGLSGDGGLATSAAIDSPRGLLVNEGALLISNGGQCRVRSVDLTSLLISTYSGTTCGYDGGSHVPSASRFEQPSGLSLATAYGGVLLGDSSNAYARWNRTITVSDLAGSGRSGFPGTTLRAPVARTRTVFSNTSYIAEADGHDIRFVKGYSGTSAGTGVDGYSGDGALGYNAQISHPQGIALDASYNLFISDNGNNVVRKVDTKTDIISTYAADPRFKDLRRISYDSPGSVYVADAGACVIWKITTAGVVSVFAGTLNNCGFGGDGAAATGALLNSPYGVFVDRAGITYIADSGNNRIRKVTALGVISTIAGQGNTCGFTGDGGDATQARLCFPEDVNLASDGTIYVADSNNRRVRKISGGIITTYAGTGVAGFNGDGLPAATANFDHPVGLAFGKTDQQLYVMDDQQNRVRLCSRQACTANLRGSGTGLHYPCRVRRLIINADDYGMTPGINRSIRECHLAGTVTSSTLMAGGAAFAAAVKDAASLPRLRVGCHVVLVDGAPLCEPASVRSLLDAEDRQRFPNGFGTVAMRALRGQLSEDEVEHEAVAQIHKLQTAGVNVDHVDTHKHTHMFPAVLRPLLRAAKACGVRAVRNPFTPPLWRMPAPLLRYSVQPALWKRFAQTQLLRGMARQFHREVRRAEMLTTDGSFGIVATGSLHLELFCAIARNLPDGTWEFVCHPGYDDADLAAIRTRLRSSRALERVVLTSPEARLALTENGAELITFADLPRPS